MDGERFDDLLRTYSHAAGASRRTLLSALAGGLAVLLGAGPAADVADAKRRRFKGRRKRKKVRGRCIPSCANRTCGGDGCGGSCGYCGNNQICLNGTCVCRLKDCLNGLCCPSSAQQCCPPTTLDPVGSCAPFDYTCCDSDDGGRSCPPAYPQCCKSTTNPRGLCLQANEGCCENDPGGGWCESATPKCCPPTTTFPAGTCCTNDQACCDDSGACEGDFVCDAGCCVAMGTLRAQGGNTSHERQDGVLRPKP
jgi:hypothetical protein